MDIKSFLRKPSNPKYREYLKYYFRYSYYILKILLTKFIRLSIQFIINLRKKILFKKVLKLDPNTNFEGLFDILVSKLEVPKKNPYVKIETLQKNQVTIVEDYWSEHTVLIQDFQSAFFSKRNLAWRFKWYPKFQELMELYGDHKGETILDFGCGPGNDTIGFGLYSNAKKIIGMDISLKALQYAQRRIQIHSEIDPKRVVLMQNSDLNPRIPLPSNAVDYIYSEGVIHHTSNPVEVLKELRRVLKPGSYANIMIYNHQSIFFHLFIAYEQMIIKKNYKGLGIHKIFNKITDGENCPISKCFKPADFNSFGKKVGFNRCEYIGGYLSKVEMDCLKNYLKDALRSRKLSKEHKDFLRTLVYDKDHLPMHEGKYAGIGGVYRFYKK